MNDETYLEMAERHVLEGKSHIRRQIKMIDDLKAAGHRRDDAESLLATFQMTLNSHVERRNLLVAEAKRQL